MSDLNSLIHTNAVNAFQQGQKKERERIIKLLEDYSDGELLVIPTGEISALIKGEQK